VDHGCGRRGDKRCSGRDGATRLTTIARGAGTLTAEFADTGRIAVARTDGSVAIYSSSGAPLRTITPSSVRENALRKDYFVTLTKTKTLEISNSRTEAFIRKWPVPGGLYALQLTTAKQAVLAREKRAIVTDEIEAPGVVYAYNSVRGIQDVGNLVFLPLARVAAALS
jgi:hypothetical protein